VWNTVGLLCSNTTTSTYNKYLFKCKSYNSSSNGRNAVITSVLVACCRTGQWAAVMRCDSRCFVWSAARKGVPLSWRQVTQSCWIVPYRAALLSLGQHGYAFDVTPSGVSQIDYSFLDVLQTDYSF
jgi:hypothetical protein